MFESYIKTSWLITLSIRQNILKGQRAYAVNAYHIISSTQVGIIANLVSSIVSAAIIASVFVTLDKY